MFFQKFYFSFCLIKKKQKIKNERYTALSFSSYDQQLYKVNWALIFVTFL
jgi:hypothetical protein